MSELLEPEYDPDGGAAFAASADIGTEMFTLVGVLDPATLSERGRVDLLIATERLKSWVDARQQRFLAEIATHPAPLPTMSQALDKQWGREEVACALRWPFSTTAAWLGNAADLVRRLPDTLDALETGTISLRHVQVLVAAVVHLSDEVTAGVQARVLPRAGTQTVAEFRRSVRQAVLSLDAAGQEQRHLVAVSERRVEVWPGEDGMSTVAAPLRADHAAAVMATLTDTARHAHPGDERTMDQRRADALVTLITGTDPHCIDPTENDAAADDHSENATAADAANDAGATDAGPGSCGQSPRKRPAVRVTVALSTLLGIDNEPGELDGYGPIPAVLARRIAGDPTGTWRRLVTDPHGQLLDYGRTVYRPPANLADHVTARDLTCRMPGCSDLPSFAIWITSSPGTTADTPTRSMFMLSANGTITPNTRPTGVLIATRTPASPTGPALPAAATANPLTHSPSIPRPPNPPPESRTTPPESRTTPPPERRTTPLTTTPKRRTTPPPERRTNPQPTALPTDRQPTSPSLHHRFRVSRGLPTESHGACCRHERSHFIGCNSSPASPS